MLPHESYGVGKLTARMKGFRQLPRIFQVLFVLVVVAGVAAGIALGISAPKVR